MAFSVESYWFDLLICGKKVSNIVADNRRCVYVIQVSSRRFNLSKALLEYRDYPLRYVRDPKLGHRVGKNSAELNLVRDGNALFWAGSSINGFYGQDDSRWQKQDEQFRILLIGGSTAMGLGATEAESILANQLESEVRSRRPKINAFVINAAVGDYSSVQELIYLATELIYLRPSLVVCLDGFNDFVHSTVGNKFSKGHWLPNTTRSYDDGIIAIHSWDKTIPRISRFQLKIMQSNFVNKIVTQRKIVRGKRFVKTNLSHNFVWDEIENWSVKNEAVTYYSKNIELMRSICENEKIGFLHFFQPSLMWNSILELPPQYKRLLEHFDEKMPGLHDLALEYFDIVMSNGVYEHNPSYDELYKNGDYWFNPYHLNDQGQHLLAKSMADSIELEFRNQGVI